MADPRTIQHHYFEAPGLAYVPFISATAVEPVFVSGTNALTTILGDLQRRPGWATYETSPTQFVDPQRVFTWRKWNGDTFILVNDIDVPGNRSVLYKLKIGVDNNFQSFLTIVTVTQPLDFVVSNNFLYINSPVGPGYRWDGTSTLNLWGITPPVISAPSTSLIGTGITAVSGYTYVFCLGSTKTNHVSSPSAISANTGVFSNKTVRVTGPNNGDPQVDRVHVFRTTDGGGGIYFELPNSPITSVAPNSWTIDDTAADTVLNAASIAPIPGFNDPPPGDATNGGIKGSVWFANRIWAFRNNKVYYSGWEEISNGVEEEAWPSGPTGNFFQFPSDVTGLATSAAGLLVFTSSAIFKILGDSRETFFSTKFIDRMGVRSRNCITTLGRACVWLDTSDTLQITDGNSIEEIGLPIRSDLINIDHSQAALTVHIDGTNHWLMLLDNADGVCRTMNLDTKRWQVPWTFSGKAICSGETASGEYTLLLAANDGKIYKMTPDAFLNPGGSAFTASIVTSLLDITPQLSTGHVGILEYVALERNDQAPDSVQQLVDDDPENVGSVFTSITDNVQPPAQREKGTYLIEEWYHSRQPRGRRVATKITWPAVNARFQVFSLDVAYRALT